MQRSDTHPLVSKLWLPYIERRPGLMDEIVAQVGETFEPLCALVSNDALWESDDVRERMALVDAINLLGGIGDSRAAPLLIDTVKRRDIDELAVSEDMSCALGWLDKGAFPRLLEAAQDQELVASERVIFMDALYIQGHLHPELRPEVAALFARILREDEDLELVSLIAADAAKMDDPDVQAALDEAMAQDRLLESVVTVAEIEEQRTREDRWALADWMFPPLEIYSFGAIVDEDEEVGMEDDEFVYSEELEYEPRGVTHLLQGPSMPYVRPGPKIGRNEPCPCGSGKKYKRCCGK